MRSQLNQLASVFRNRHARWITLTLSVVMVGLLCWQFISQAHRKPPSIFDAPVEDIFSYLAGKDFSQLSIEERMGYIQSIIKRFSSMGQSESAAASGFLAGLTGPASEKLVHNARILGKDVFVQGAGEFLALKTERERNEFLDRWIIKWVRFSEEATGRSSGRSDEEILANLSKQARRDLRSGVTVDADLAQQLIDFWDRDVASVASPKEQAQMFQFGPALRQRLISRAR